LILNGLNPFIILIWISLISVTKVNYNYNTTEQTYFFTGLLVSVFISDVSKALVAHRLKHLINPKIFKRINLIVGGLLIVFGLRIIYFLINTYLL
jgi:threonine/homoserine/homoserine lactone efflux protein